MPFPQECCLHALLHCHPLPIPFISAPLDGVPSACSSAMVAVCAQECCGKLHKTQQMKPVSPEQLLRARFSAFAKKGG
eukprot:357886-Chlamydomonas_euryale.AAC.12